MSHDTGQKLAAWHDRVLRLEPQLHAWAHVGVRPNRSQVDQSIFSASIRICTFDHGSGHTSICNICIRVPGEKIWRCHIGYLISVAYLDDHRWVKHAWAACTYVEPLGTISYTIIDNHKGMYNSWNSFYFYPSTI
jgi:hypothetical protein